MYQPPVFYVFFFFLGRATRGLAFHTTRRRNPFWACAGLRGAGMEVIMYIYNSYKEYSSELMQMDFEQPYLPRHIPGSALDPSPNALTVVSQGSPKLVQSLKE